MAETRRGVVLRLEGNVCFVDADGERLSCFLPKSHRREARRGGGTALAPGDRVSLEPADDANRGLWRIVEVEERRSALSRRRLEARRPGEDVLIANPDRLLVVAACDRPPFNPRFADRLLCAGELHELECLLVLNKLDLVEPGVADESVAPYRAAGYRCLVVSAADGRGIDELRGLLGTGLTLLAGRSGVGKSSLLNACFPDFDLRVGAVSDYSDKGVHTTTSPELFPLGGGYVADTPGVRVFALWGVTVAELAGLFPDIARYSDDCRFGDCRHRSEPSCAVKAAVEAGELDAGRYAGYLTVLEELEAVHRQRY